MVASAASELDAVFEEDQSGWGVVVVSAAKLINKDTFSKNDSYCIARVGPSCSKWDDKGAPQRSATVDDENDPVWDFGFAVDAAADSAPLEVTCRVMDADPLVDDLIGEVTFALDPNARNDASPAPIVLELTTSKYGKKRAGSLTVKVGAKAMI